MEARRSPIERKDNTRNQSAEVLKAILKKLMDE
jgi:hypothetical protein